MADSNRTPDVDDTMVADGSGTRRVPGQMLPRGASLGRYMVLSRIGAGGMGAVYTAYDPELDRKLAIKLLHAEHASGTSGASGGAARLLREAQAMARLNHPNVITVHDVGTFEGEVFVAMEFVEGETLARWLERPRPWSEVLARLIAAGRGLAAAHRAGLVHRDFKPENVLLGSDGRVQVADFGLARGAQTSEPAEPADPELLPTSSTSSLSDQLTLTGMLMGTPAYMAPEQHARGPVDERSDQFSFCVALYEGLYGQRPFAGDTMAALAFQVCQGKVREPPPGSVPGRLKRIVVRGLARRPEDRYPSMDALLSELERQPGARRRWALLGAGAGLFGVAAVAGSLVAGGASPCARVGAGLDGVWDAARREQVKGALEASGVAYAADVWSRLEPTLDAYASAWTASQRDACEATHIRGEQSEHMLDLRTLCLQRRREHLHHTVELLAQADADIVERAPSMVASLPALAPCADVTALAARVPPPEDPGQCARVEALAREVAQVDALRDGGRLKEARALAGAVAERARELDYRPIQAEATQALGSVASKLDEPDAESILLDAAGLALASGHDEVFVHAGIALLSEIGSDRAREAQAHHWMRLVEATIERLGDDEATRATYLIAKTAALRRQDDAKNALAAAEEAIAIRERMGAEPTQLADAYNAKAAAVYDLGDVAAARELMHRGLELGREGYGPDHPRIVQGLNNIAVTHMATGEYARAQELLDEVVERRLRTLGPDHISTVDARSNLGLVLLEVDDVASAEAHLRHVLEVYEARYGESNSDVGECLSNLAAALEALGRTDEARAALERAGEVFTRAEGEGWRYGMTLAKLGALDRSTGDPAAGLEKLARAVVLVEAHFGAGHPRLLSVQLDLVESEMEAGQLAQARARVEPLLAPLADQRADVHLLATARFQLARALVAEDPTRARELGEQARDALEHTPGTKARRLRVRVEAWLREQGSRVRH